ncbi:MAG: dihydroorotate dehydrogenase electron transfer subunit [Clostridiales bacterium]|nr:dihydroorotate dehydrogenase electron transfer subunit [Clostridiales bacterium]
MKESCFTLEKIRTLTEDTCELILRGDTSAITRPGQFVNLALPEKFLRRPISVCDWWEDTLVLLIRAVGEGSRCLTQSRPGTVFNVLSGLGNGFATSSAGARPVLVGGGVGAAPLYGLARRMAQVGTAPTVALGFRRAVDALYIREFEALGCRVMTATEDGSLGTRGFVTDSMAEACWDYAYVCGPTPMLRAVCDLPWLTDGQYSFEARMGCGFGACMGCSISTVHGSRRVCKDGPIFTREEIVW